MKVLFVYPNVLLCSRIPISIATLVTVAHEADWDTALFDTTFMKEGGDISDDEMRHATFQVKEANLSDYGVTWEDVDIDAEFDSCLDKEKPDLVAIGITENMYKIARRLGRRAKIKNYPVIVGGAMPTAAPDELIVESWVDILCVGEGEIAFKTLLENLATGKDVSSINNIWIKRESGEIVKNELGPLIDMNIVPYQSWDIFDEKHIWRPIGGKVYRTGNFMLSRGCPYGCTYCVNNQLIELYKGKGTYHREISVDRMVEEIGLYKKKYNLELIQFHDEIFLLMTKKRLTELMDAYKKHIGLPFSIVTYTQTISGFSMKTVVDAGCINIAMSIESGSPHIRKMLFKRNISNSSIHEAFKTAKKYGVRISTSNIIGNPYETREQIFETIMLNKACKPDSANVNMIYPYKGTEMYDICVREGFYKPGEHNGDGGVRMDSVLDLPQISKKELAGIQRTFQFYMHFPEKDFPRIRRAEELSEVGDQRVNELSIEFRERFGDVG